MKTDRFLIGYADANSGLQTNIKPWLIPDNAFANLSNVYIFRGRVRKRLGSVWMGQTQLNSRFGYVVATTDGSGDSSDTVPGAIFEVGQMFSIAEDVFTVSVTGTPATLLSTNGSASMTYNTTTGAFTSTNATALTDVIFYPAQPVMGLTQYFDPTADEPLTIGFDTQFSYYFDTTSNTWIAFSGGDDTWTGDDSQFFWSTNYQGATADLNLLWTTNFNTDDGFRYYDGSSWTKPTLTYNNSDEIYTSRIIVQFKNRLLLLNTIEEVSSTATHFFNRVRYSALNSPLQSDAFRQDIPGKGGSLDAPVQEEIVTAQFIKDRLIVYFEESTFELAYTGNQIQPFVWQKINTELGAESTFSEIPFDKQVFGIDNIGIHECNGANVQRIDQNIPQLSFGFSNTQNGPERIVGIRDYYNEIVYWTYPNQVRNDSFYFPNRMLVFNYSNNAWSTFTDSFTFFGYFLYQEETPGSTWGNTYPDWQDITDLWNSAADTQTSIKVKSVIAGNQQGYVTVLRGNIARNASNLQVTNVNSFSSGTMTLSVVNHNLEFNDFIMLSDMTGMTFTDSLGNELTSVIARVSTDPYISNTPNTIVVSLLDNLSQPMQISGTYTGNGVIARVSNIIMLTKQYNFYTAADRNVYISKVDFLVDSTTNGKVTVDFLISSSGSSFLSEALSLGSILGDNTLDTSPYALVPFEQFQNRLWHPVYFYAEGECVQFNIFMSQQQMFNYDLDANDQPTFTALQDFQLNSMVIYAQPTSSRMQ